MKRRGMATVLAGTDVYKRQRIDKAGAVSSGHGTVVIIHPDSAVWDVLQKIKTRVRIRNFKIIDSAEIAVADWSEVIAHACAIDDIIMIMKTRCV